MTYSYINYDLFYYSISLGYIMSFYMKIRPVRQHGS